MATLRVWNITDSGKPGVSAHNRMVLGQSLKPGQFMRVDEMRLKGATKMKADVDAGMLHVGTKPPDWYAKMKKPPRAVVDARVVNEDGSMVGKRPMVVATGHEKLPAEAIAADSAAKIEAVITEPVVKAPVEEEAPAEEAKEEDSEEDSSYRGRRKRRK